MVEIKHSEEIPEDILQPISELEEPGEKKTFDTELELRKYLGSVQSRIKKEISDDFKHAKLDDQDKKAVIDMTDNAYNIVRIYGMIETHATKWDWNKNKGVWEKRFLNQDERSIVRKLGRNIFDTLMTKVTMTCIMNINKADNDLVKLLANPNREEDKTEKTIIEMADNIKEKKKKKEETEDKS